MALYPIGREVWSRSQKRVGTISEANYSRMDGKAQYLVAFGEGDDYLCGSVDLRAADWTCDGCGRELPGHPHHLERVMVFGEQDDAIGLCFLCCLQGEQSELEMAIAEQRLAEEERAAQVARGIAVPD